MSIQRMFGRKTNPKNITRMRGFWYHTLPACEHGPKLPQKEHIDAKTEKLPSECVSTQVRGSRRVFGLA
jgi:hypothetical protein